jgi:LPXTG-motif cell wall-anchored protein
VAPAASVAYGGTASASLGTDWAALGSAVLGAGALASTGSNIGGGVASAVALLLLGAVALLLRRKERRPDAEPRR